METVSAPGRKEQGSARRLDQDAAIRDAGLDHQQGREAALLTHEREYAFGEMDEVGMSNVADRSSCGAALLQRTASSRLARPH